MPFLRASFPSEIDFDSPSPFSLMTNHYTSGPPSTVIKTVVKMLIDDDRLIVSLMVVMVALLVFVMEIPAAVGGERYKGISIFSFVVGGGRVMEKVLLFFVRDESFDTFHLLTERRRGNFQNTTFLNFPTREEAFNGVYHNKAWKYQLHEEIETYDVYPENFPNPFNINENGLPRAMAILFPSNNQFGTSHVNISSDFQKQLVKSKSLSVCCICLNIRIVISHGEPESGLQKGMKCAVRSLLISSRVPSIFKIFKMAEFLPFNFE